MPLSQGSSGASGSFDGVGSAASKTLDALGSADDGAVIAIPAAADLLDHRWPPAGAWVLVLLSAPEVLVVDAFWKRWTTVTPSSDPRS